jgi:hypothetical protein
MTQIATIPAAAGAIERPAVNLLDAINMVIARPDIDVAKIAALIDFQIKIEERNAKSEFFAALSRVQALVPRVKKMGSREIRGDTHGRYALYEDIDAVLRPLYIAEGFALAFGSDDTGAKMSVTMTVTHRLGHAEFRSITLSLDTGGSKNATQAGGSTVSYGQRYLIKMFFNIITVGADDDAQGDRAQPISVDQVTVLQDMIREHKRDVTRFCKYMEVATLTDIRRGDYKRAVDAIERTAEAAQRQR